MVGSKTDEPSRIVSGEVVSSPHLGEPFDESGAAPGVPGTLPRRETPAKRERCRPFPTTLLVGAFSGILSLKDVIVSTPPGGARLLEHEPSLSWSRDHRILFEAALPKIGQLLSKATVANS